ncbi:hypothetical protein GCM10010344_35220 [Streptomyces bluensis]|nr:hypothetical protein GCM10010344_35220 [Streptomyces bluensis]
MTKAGAAETKAGIKAETKGTRALKGSSPGPVGCLAGDAQNCVSRGGPSGNPVFHSCG